MANLIADHQLRERVPQLGPAATLSFIKDPKAPMPKLYPALLTDQNVIDVAAYLQQTFGR